MQDIEFLLRPLMALLSGLYISYPLIIVCFILAYISKRQTQKRSKLQLEYPMEYSEYEERNEDENVNVVPEFKPGDFMTLADIQDLLNLKRSATALWVKKVELKSWKFGKIPTHMYLRKDVMGLFKQEEE